jgi:TM2 domain-containing membrane protein YozV
MSFDRNFKHMTTGSSGDASKKITAGICGILLGGFGVHKFVLGYSTEGVIMLLVGILGGVVTCGLAWFVMAVIGLAEGVVYLTKSDDEFINTYINNKRGWF